MKKVKWIPVVLAAALSMTLLAACQGNTDDQPDSQTNNGEETEEFTVTYYDG